MRDARRWVVRGMAVLVCLLLIQGCGGGGSGSSSSGQPDPGVPPVLGALQNQVVEVGVPLEFEVTATHPEGEPVTIAADPRPRGATFDGTTFRWTPEVDQARVHDVKFSATAGNLSDNKWITITVTYDPPPQDEGEAVSETFTQAAEQVNGEVDVLFVLDTSGSMLDKRGRLADEVPLILDQLTDVGIHRFAFLLGWGWPDPSGGYEGSGHLYRMRENGWILDSEVLPVEEMRATIADTLRSEPPVDMSTDGGEAGLYSLNRLLTTHLNTARERNFLIPGRNLAVIFLSDENDICADYPDGVTRVPDPDMVPGDPDGRSHEEYARDRYCFDPPFSQIRAITSRSVYEKAVEVVGAANVLFTGLLYLDENTVPTGGGTEEEVGYGYLEAIDVSGGFAEDLAAESYAGAAQRFGYAINALTAELQRSFLLNRSPVNPESIRVSVAGVELLPNQFRYELATNSVVLSDYAGAPEDLIQIQYRVLTP